MATTGTHGTAIFPKDRARTSRVDEKVATELAKIGIQIEKYRGSRFWAVRRSGELVAVTVYKKGAISIGLLLLASYENTAGSKGKRTATPI